MRRFNTSYVSVQANTIKKLSSWISVSIHLMCRFKLPLAIAIASSVLFQYILCVGSSNWSR